MDHRYGRISEDAVPKSEVERSPDHDDEIGLRKRCAAGAGHQVRIARRNDTTAHAVGDNRDVALVDEVPRSIDRITHPHIAAEDHDRTLRCGQHGGGDLEQIRVGIGPPIDASRVVW